MAHKHSSGEAAPGRSSILPLPDDVVAQIKSSTTIVSLNGVVLGLLKNALDAQATKIDATVDWTRGGCTVEDNGLGIAPLDLREGGSLGKLYHTSKYNSHDECHGRNGTFLASLAAMSLLSITSHHHEHRSHNSVTFHHAKTVERLLPVPPQSEVNDKDHGTRVTVRNLFGNLPVRVKQRALAAEQKSEYDRLREVLKRDVTCLLLGWRHKVSVTLRDAENVLILNTKGLMKNHEALVRQSNSADFHSILSILTQANYTSFDEWNSWIPAVASTSAVSIRGAISIEPAPTKRVQFMSLGIIPLLTDTGYNELYDEVNRLFSSSSFGTIEADADVDDDEKLRRQNDNRFKSDGYTSRQLRARKGVDRYPMFYLRINLRNGSSDGRFLDQEANFHAVIEILNALITQWLVAHQFRPPRSRKHPKPKPPLLPCDGNIDTQTLLATRDKSESGKSSCDNSAHSDGAESLKKKRSRPRESNTDSRTARVGSFTGWSRIKTSKPEFYDHIWTSRKAKDKRAFLKPNSMNRPITPGPDLPLPRQSSPSSQKEIIEDDTRLIEPTLTSSESQVDGTITWFDPSTKKTHYLNARTGCVIPQIQMRPRSGHSSSAASSSLSENGKSIRLGPKPSSPIKTPFLDELLDSWQNPIFKPTQMRIPQINLAVDTIDQSHSNHSNCAHIDARMAFTQPSLSGNSKLSKAGLRGAQVLAQVDKKFVLVKIVNCHPSNDQNSNAEILVLVDQHAADERIRVESLLAHMCMPLSKTDSLFGYRSKLGHVSKVSSTLLDKPMQFVVSLHERDLLVTFAAQFALWGILYDVQTPTDASTNCFSTAEKQQAQLSVTALPPSISERCKADPKLLVSFLRTTVWKYAEDPKSSPASLTAPLEDVSSNEQPSWIRQISTCPSGLLDMINSRACRSAIMFNDELKIEECTKLISKLATCVFPFMCAHGRPSMVPLVDMGELTTESGLGLDIATTANISIKDRAFVSAWKAWKRK